MRVVHANPLACANQVTPPCDVPGYRALGDTWASVSMMSSKSTSRQRSDPVISGRPCCSAEAVVFNACGLETARPALSPQATCAREPNQTFNEAVKKQYFAHTILTKHVLRIGWQQLGAHAHVCRNARRLCAWSRWMIWFALSTAAWAA